MKIRKTFSRPFTHSYLYKSEQKTKIFLAIAHFNSANLQKYRSEPKRLLRKGFDELSGWNGDR
jgi:hypothetical protein